MAEGKELMLFEKPALPEWWDYKTSVSKVQQFIYKWKNITQDVASELWIARENLNQDRSRDTSGAFAPMGKTWSGYCEEIGINKSTANRWLNRWFPKEIGEGSGNNKPVRYNPSIIRERGSLFIICPHCNHNWKVKSKEISHV